MIFYYGADNSINDIEKLLIPSITFVNTNNKLLNENRRKGFMFSIKWWHYSIYAGIFH